MNGYQSSARPFSERELDLQRASDFHAVLLGMAAHDLRQPLQVIQSTYEWLAGRFDVEADKARLQRGQRAATKLAEHFPATVELSIGALIVAVMIGIPAGIFAALRRNGVLDILTMSAVLLGVSTPVFVLGWMLVYLLAVVPSNFGLNLFPISGRISLTYYVPTRTHLIVLDALLAGNVRAALDALWHLVLPAVTLGTIPLAIVAKITRSGMLEVLRSDYVRTARAKGLGPAAVVVKHALRNALIPILTVVGLQTGLLLGGAVLTEHIFAWPGVGRLAFEAISNRDMPLINGCILLFAAVFVVVNAAVDVVYAAVNPRVRYR